MYYALSCGNVFFLIHRKWTRNMNSLIVYKDYSSLLFQADR